MNVKPPKTHARIMGFELISKVPLAFAWRGFATHDECEALVAHAEAAREIAQASGDALSYGLEGFSRIALLNGKIYLEVDEDREGLGAVARGMVDRFDRAVSQLFGFVPSKGQWQSVVNATPQSPVGTPPGLLNGLHVDTCNDSPLRMATSLLYLRTVEAGGETLFAASSEAGEALLDAGIEATFDERLEGSDTDSRLDSAKLELEGACRALVPPAQGTLLVFFVRRPDGKVDPAGFHGSANPLSGDKWTLQTFWAAPTPMDAQLQPQRTAEAYASERHACRRFFRDLRVGDSVSVGV